MELKNQILNFITQLVPQSVKRRIIVNSQASDVIIYSQEGEDKLLERLVGSKTYGIYVDVGAHHPTFINNTYFFYKKGWRGINIDAMPGSMNIFKKIRPYDINIEQAISDTIEEIPYFTFNTPELNTFDKTKVDVFLKYPDVQLLNTMTLKTATLESVLDKYLNLLGTHQIDIMTVDVEGFDIKVLKSNNWGKYRPAMVLAEDLFSNISQCVNSELNAFMESVGYTMKAKTLNTVFFQENTK